MNQLQEIDLPTLAREIDEHHSACLMAAESSLDHAREAGRLLTEAKGLLPHGQFAGWLAENFAGSPRTAQVYMRVFRRWPEIRAKAQSNAHLGIDRALRLIATPSQKLEDKQREMDGQKLFGLIFPEGITCYRRETENGIEGIALDFGGCGAVLTPISLEVFGRPTPDQFRALARAVPIVAAGGGQ